MESMTQIHTETVTPVQSTPSPLANMCVDTEAKWFEIFNNNLQKFGSFLMYFSNFKAGAAAVLLLARWHAKRKHS